jgi:hypothetical protein
MGSSSENSYPVMQLACLQKQNHTLMFGVQNMRQYDDKYYKHSLLT